MILSLLDAASHQQALQQVLWLIFANHHGRLRHTFAKAVGCGLFYHAMTEGLQEFLKQCCALGVRTTRVYEQGV